MIRPNSGESRTSPHPPTLHGKLAHENSSESFTFVDMHCIYKENKEALRKNDLHVRNDPTNLDSNSRTHLNLLTSNQKHIKKVLLCRKHHPSSSHPAPTSQAQKCRVAPRSPFTQATRCVRFSGSPKTSERARRTTDRRRSRTAVLRCSEKEKNHENASCHGPPVKYDI